MSLPSPVSTLNKEQSYRLSLSIIEKNNTTKTLDYFVEHKVTAESLAKIAGSFFGFTDKENAKALRLIFLSSFTKIDFSEKNSLKTYRMETTNFIQRQKDPYFYSPLNAKFNYVIDYISHLPSAHSTGRFLSPPNNSLSTDTTLTVRALFIASTIDKIEAFSDLKSLSVEKTLK